MSQKNNVSPGVRLEGDALVFAAAAVSYASVELMGERANKLMLADCFETLGDWYTRLGPEQARDVELRLIAGARRELQRRGQLNIWTTASRWNP